jgi:peptide/nickel transport system substrate-binding protein
MESAPIIPLYYDQVSHFIRNCIQDFPTNPVNMLDLRRVKKMSDEN